ncbi:MAG: hypothetical protein NTY20_04765 [Candidatus Aenigmarchaeota archaeon]|nr:hypothetical protein [Candidatus Aenigmarchaeota archaeon]
MKELTEVDLRKIEVKFGIPLFTDCSKCGNYALCMKDNYIKCPLLNLENEGGYICQE